MATTQNTFTGNGSNLGPFSFTFKWLEPTDIKVSVAGVLKTVGTHYNLVGLNYSNKDGGQVTFLTGQAPANGAAIVIYRQTDDSSVSSVFYPGSAIRSQDLNDNFTQGLYVNQEVNNSVAAANTTANTALTNSNTAITTANAATATANTASSNASAAVATANTASTNASAAVSTANTASSNATTAVNTANAATATANTAASNASTALSTANSALSTANTASTNATNAVNTANSASSAASSAVSTANTASTNASNAVTTANTATSTANTALSTANTAISTANAAASAVASAILYDIVANVAAIPGSPANNDAVEITNSTGIESFSPLSGLPSGFVGNSALSVRLVYTTSGSTWNWIQYFPNDPETRYLKTGTGTVTSTNIADGTIVDADVNASAAIAGTKISPDFGSQTVQTTGIFSHALGTAGAPTITFTGDTNTGIYSPGADQVAISTNGVGRLFIDASGNVSVGSSSPLSTFDVANSGDSVVRIRSTIGDSAYLLIQNSDTGTTGSDGVYIGIDNAENAYFYNFENKPLIFGTNNAERLRITADGKLGLGTSAPGTTLEVAGSSYPNFLSNRSLSSGGSGAAGWTAARIQATTTEQMSAGFGVQQEFALRDADGVDNVVANLLVSRDGADNSGSFAIRTASAGTLGTRLHISSGGLVGIGTTSPTTDATRTLHVASSGPGTNALVRVAGNNGTGVDLISGGDSLAYLFNRDNTGLVFGTNNTERARIDSSGRLLVGTSTARSDFFNTTSFAPRLQVEGTDFSTSMLSVTCNATGANTNLVLARSRGTANGAVTVVADGDTLGNIQFQGADGTDLVVAASIAAVVDGTPGTNDMPGRLVFSTTADGASSPTERMRIRNNGDIYIGKDNDTRTNIGFTFTPSVGVAQVTSGSQRCFDMNRQTDDGSLIDFYQANTLEGSISVSGTTVSYNGAHLSRWSQLPGGTEREEIMRGTVLSNIDEMCDWGEEENEQLNRIKVSDVEGDPNVAGVFQGWDDDDDTYTDDFYCAMTGDFIIRIAENVSVQRGDLLMSAGDGTAKPQDDDIIRSKTIAKVTSTHVTCTYDDGSYCVPCVLMAC
jgi:hypothetical protein